MHVVIVFWVTVEDVSDNQTTALLSYRALDGRQLETVRVDTSGSSLRATGYVISTGHSSYGTTYSLVVDDEGRSRRMSVRCDDASGQRSVSLTRSPGGPWIFETITGSETHGELDDATDVYLVGSAFAVSLPIRRLHLHETVGAQAEVTVASIHLPDLTVQPVVHSGVCEQIDADGQALINYSGPYGDRQLLIDSDGYFVGTPGLSQRA